MMPRPATLDPAVRAALIAVRATRSGRAAVRTLVLAMLLTLPACAAGAGPGRGPAGAAGMLCTAEVVNPTGHAFDEVIAVLGPGDRAVGTLEPGGSLTMTVPCDEGTLRVRAVATATTLPGGGHPRAEGSAALEPGTVVTVVLEET